MDNDQVFKIVRRSNFNRLVVGFITLAIVIFGAYSAKVVQRVVAFANPPTNLSIADVEKIDVSELPIFNVRIVGEKLIDSGYTYEETENGNTRTTKNYGVLILTNRILLTESSRLINEKDKEAVGDLYPVSAELNREILDDIELEQSGTKELFLPFVVTNTDTTWGFGVIVVVLAGLFGLWALLTALWRYGDANRHPILKKLKRYGEPEEVARQIAEDITFNGSQVGKVHVGRKWLVYAQKSNFQANPLEDIAWCFQRTTTNRVNFVPVSKTFTAEINNRFGEKITIISPEKQVFDMLVAIAQAAPWAMIGWNTELDQLWRKDRSKFLGHVEARKHRDENIDL